MYAFKNRYIDTYGLSSRLDLVVYHQVLHQLELMLNNPLGKDIDLELFPWI